jgi:hypothetical protein
MIDAMKRFADNRCSMGSRPNKVNSVTIPANMLEKIAATNHLAIADVVRLFLVQALPELEWKLEALEVSSASQRRFTYKAGNVIETHEQEGDFQEW